jgi:predicted anti-sigma-YlaC factor YlaD
MGMTCQEVWRDVSHYIDDELEPLQRIAVDEHVAECRRCRAVLEGMRNVISIYQDERVFAPPPGFHERLLRRFESERKRRRNMLLGWTLAAAAAVPLTFAVLTAKKFMLGEHETRNPGRLAAPTRSETPDLVAISEDHDDKFYHVAGCSHLIGKPKFIGGEEAIREGYMPCPYCIAKRAKKTG